MTDERRMTTDRFYGGISDRLQNLLSMLEYVNEEKPSRNELNDWIISNTKAGSPDAVSHHLTFLNSVDLIELDERHCELGHYGEEYLADQSDQTLYECLSSGVKGFDTLLEELSDGPMTDEDIMNLLVDEFEEAEMSKPGPAMRHREWLQVLGYVEREGEVNRLTEKGRELLRSREPEVDLEQAEELRSDDLKQNDTPEDRPTIWIEKTDIHDEYKEIGGGELSLGRAILSPQRDKGGGDRYYRLRDAEKGDIVVHLLQEESKIVGASVIDSELITDYDFPPEVEQRWSEEQREQGGYLRRLSEFEQFDDPPNLYDDILNNPDYVEKLEEIYEENTGLFYDKNRSLFQGSYLTECPAKLANVLADASDELNDYFIQNGFETEDIEPPSSTYSNDIDTDRIVSQYLDERDWEEKHTQARETAKAVRKLADELTNRGIMSSDEFNALRNLYRVDLNPDTQKDMVKDLPIDGRVKQEVFNHIENGIGIVGGRQNYMNIEEEDEPHLLEFFNTLLSTSNKEKIDSAIDNLAAKDPKGLQSGRVSPFVYLFQPKAYPVNNGPARQGMKDVFGIEVSGDLKDYTDTVSDFKRIRDEYGFESDYRDLDYFLQSYDEYTGGTTPEYDSIAEATEVILELVEESEYENPLFSRVDLKDIRDWWDALHGFQPNSYVTPEEEEVLLEIEAVLDDLRPELDEISKSLDIEGLNSMSPTEITFLAFVREYQQQLPLSSSEQVNANQPKLNSILNRAYWAYDNPEHPLVEPLRGEGETEVYVCTAPPSYWMSVIRHRLMGFEPDDESQWEDINEGDFLVFHASESTMDSELSKRDGGLVGAGIVKRLFKRDSADQFQAYDSIEGSNDYPNLAAFERLFVTGSEFSDIDPSPPTAPAEQRGREIGILISDAPSISEVNEICNSVADKGFPAEGSVKRLADSGDEFGRREAVIDRLADELTEISPFSVYRGFHGGVPERIFDGLHFPSDQGMVSPDELAQQISAALRSGKHIIFTGPPGTGKTEVAERTAEYLADSHSYLYSGWELTTATADWSTFNTVGGYMPSPEADTDQLDFNPGILLNRFKKRHESETEEDNVSGGGLSSSSFSQANEPTVVDEINRADIDKAFGQLFTTFSGQSVTIPYRFKDHPNQEIEIITAEEVSPPIKPSQFVVPESWRLFGTMNTFDKTSLHELSYAFMRRFTFIRIGVPDVPEEGDERERFMQDYANEDVWDVEATPTTLRYVADIWEATNEAVEQRSIGPAIIEDILSYVSAHQNKQNTEERLVEAVISYIFPQLEGVPERKDIVANIASETKLDGDDLERAAQDMLGIDSLGSDSDTGA